jgi:Zn-dependent membrane protease YugP
MLRTNRKLVFLMQMRDSRGPFILSIAYAVHELGHYVEDKSYIRFFSCRCAMVAILYRLFTLATRLCYLC